MNSGKVLLGLLAGIAAGATLGILFAPDKGTATRKKISEKGDEYADELGEKFNSFIDSITQKFETVRKDAAKMVENGKSKMKEMDGELMGSESKKM